MKATDAAREVLFPLTDMGIVMAMLVFWLLGSLAIAAGWLGLWLLAIVLPAFFRYALYLLEARAKGQDPPVPDIEMFNLIDNGWSLFPLVLIAAFVGLVVYLAVNVSALAAFIGMVVLFLILPACLGILAVTRSPLTSINPVSLFTLIRTMGPDYLWAPAVTVAVLALLLLAATAGLPDFLLSLSLIYVYFLMFTLTGSLLQNHRIDAQVDIPDAQFPDEKQVERELIAAREKVANHAYGFLSRGNRAGGLHHIEARLRDEGDADDAWYWFFTEMLKWEDKDHALFFAQRYLNRLLGQARELEVQKLLSRCLLENPRFRPAGDDREATLELLRRHGRDDILRQLQG